MYNLHTAVMQIDAIGRFEACGAGGLVEEGILVAARFGLLSRVFNRSTFTLTETLFSAGRLFPPRICIARSAPPASQ